MKDCSYFQQLISLLTDRELTAEEGEELAAHAKECDDCRALYAAFASLSEALKTDLEEPPEELSELVMASVRRDMIRTSNTSKKRQLRMIAAAACALIVIGAGAAAAFGRRSKETMSVMSATGASYDTVTEEAAAYDTGTYGAENSEAEENAPMFGLGIAPAETAEESIAVSDDFAAPAAETTKSEDEMIADALRRAEEPETVAEIVDVTGQGRGQRIRQLLTGTQGALPSSSTPDRRFVLRFDSDGISTQVLISVYGDKVFFISLSGEESDMVLADCSWSKLRSAIYD